MRHHRLIVYSSVAAVALAVLSLALLRTGSDNSASGLTPRTPEGRPDLSGYWFDDRDDPIPRFRRGPDGLLIHDDVQVPEGERPPWWTPEGTPGEGWGDGVPGYGTLETGQNYNEASLMPPYKPEWLEKVRATADDSLGPHLHPGDPYFHCKPLGVPRVVRPGHHWGFQAIQHRDFLAFLYEEGPNSVYRLIYLDGRSHPPEVARNPSYFGHSIGRWEGDTLVVDTVGLNDETLLDDVADAGPFAQMLLLHSDQLRVVERFTRDGDMLTYEATVHDPVAFTEPLVITPRHIRLGPSDDYIWALRCDAGEELEQLAKMAEARESR